MSLARVAPLLLLVPLSTARDPASALERCERFFLGMNGRSDAEMTASCRASLKRDLCQKAKDLLGALPWTPDRIAHGCRSLGFHQEESPPTGVATAKGASNSNANELDYSLKHKPAPETRRPSTSETFHDPPRVLPDVRWSPWGHPNELNLSGGSLLNSSSASDFKRFARMVSRRRQAMAAAGVTGMLELMVLDAPRFRNDSRTRPSLERAIAKLARVRRANVTVSSMRENWGKFLEQDGHPFIPGVCYVDVAFTIRPENPAEASTIAGVLAATRLRQSSSWEAEVHREMRLSGLLPANPVRVMSAALAGNFSRPSLQKQQASPAALGMLAFSANDTAGLLSDPQAHRAIEASISHLSGLGGGRPTITSVGAQPLPHRCLESKNQTHKCPGSKGGVMQVYFVIDAQVVEALGTLSLSEDRPTAVVVDDTLRSALLKRGLPYMVHAGSFRMLLCTAQMQPARTTGMSTVRSPKMERMLQVKAQDYTMAANDTNYREALTKSDMAIMTTAPTEATRRLSEADAGGLSGLWSNSAYVANLSQKASGSEMYLFLAGAVVAGVTAMLIQGHALMARGDPNAVALLPPKAEEEAEQGKGGAGAGQCMCKPIPV